MYDNLNDIKRTFILELFSNCDSAFLDSSGGEIAVQFLPDIFNNEVTTSAAILIEFYGNITNGNNENWVDDIVVRGDIVDNG